MLILSHPRSGSTEICRIVELCLHKPSLGSVSLGEFFNASDRTLFGNLIDAFHHFRTSADPKTVSVLVIDKNKIINKRYIAGHEYLNTAVITFDSLDHLNHWFYSERLSRLEFINSIDKFYIIKHFITLFDNPIDNEFEAKFNRELINSQIEQGKVGFSYRRNLLETVFSGLIKTFYFDNSRAGKSDNNLLRIMADGHNIYDMPVLQPEPIRIPNQLEDDGKFFQINGIIMSTLMLFEFYHLFIGKLPIGNILCYEDIMETQKLTLTYQGRNWVYNIDKLPPRIFHQYLEDGTVKEVTEKKMNYGDYSKEDYFINSHIVKKVIDNEVNKIETRSPGFKETLRKLGIIY